MRNPHGKHIVKKKHKKQTKTKKRESKVCKTPFRRKKTSCFLPDLLRFCVNGKDKHVFSKGDFLVPPTQD